MKIEAKKTYITRNGQKVRIVCTNIKSLRPIMGVINNEEIVEFTKKGRYYSDDKKSELDLIREYSFWNDIEVDTPIYVRNSDNGIWLHRHFAKYENGRISAWTYGRTSFTSEKSSDITYWRYGKLKDIK